MLFTYFITSQCRTHVNAALLCLSHVSTHTFPMADCVTAPSASVLKLEPPYATGPQISRVVVTSLNYCHTFTDSEELTQPVSSDMNSGLLLTCAMPHTRAHTLQKKKKMCVLAADPPWRLIPPHFLRPLLLSNWGSGEYNYGENHPGLMWGRINGIKKIICWPSGPTAVWGWEGNLKPKEEEIGGFNERADESLWPPRGSLGVPLGDYFLQDSPT